MHQFPRFALNSESHFYVTLDERLWLTSYQPNVLILVLRNWHLDLNSALSFVYELIFINEISVFFLKKKIEFKVLSLHPSKKSYYIKETYIQIGSGRLSLNVIAFGDKSSS